MIGQKLKKKIEVWKEIKVLWDKWIYVELYDWYYGLKWNPMTVIETNPCVMYFNDVIDMKFCKTIFERILMND